MTFGCFLPRVAPSHSPSPASAVALQNRTCGHFKVCTLLFASQPSRWFTFPLVSLWGVDRQWRTLSTPRVSSFEPSGKTKVKVYFLRFPLWPTLWPLGVRGGLDSEATVHQGRLSRRKTFSLVCLLLIGWTWEHVYDRCHSFPRSQHGSAPFKGLCKGCARVQRSFASKQQCKGIPFFLVLLCAREKDWLPLSRNTSLFHDTRCGHFDWIWKRRS